MCVPCIIVEAAAVADIAPVVAHILALVVKDMDTVVRLPDRSLVVGQEVDSLPGMTDRAVAALDTLVGETDNTVAVVAVEFFQRRL